MSDLFTTIPNVSPGELITADFQNTVTGVVNTLEDVVAVNWKGVVKASTTAALTSYTYSNGTSGVGATLTATANGAFPAQDGQTLVIDDYLLVNGETGANAPYNGKYQLTQVGDSSTPWILTRSVDMDLAALMPGAVIYVALGSVKGNTLWAMPNYGPFTVGTTDIGFSQVGGEPLVAGTGISISGSTVSLVTPVSITDGGTGAGSAAGALSNLGAAASGANADITGMTDLTGVLQAPTQINDPNGNAVLTFASMTLAVNDVTIQNATTGNAPQLQANGSDSNISLNLVPKGTGSVQAGGVPIVTTSDSINSLAAPTADFSMNSHRITNLLDPTNAQDAVTKNYVDNIAQGLVWKGPVKARTTGALPSYTYNNGSSGVGATLTATSNGALPAQDSQTLATSDFLLVANETGSNAPYNGRYQVTQAGDASDPWILTRSLDMDESADIAGATMYVELGSTYENTQWTVTGAGPFTIGTTPIAFSQLAGPGSITAGTGLAISGTVISLVTPVAVANGGTGASTAAAARASLGAAAAGANSDITSMSGLTGALQAPTKINDASGNEVLGFSSVTSAVNELTVQNAATGSAPQLQATGSDANVDLDLVPKGSGSVSISGPVDMSSNQINNLADPTAAHDAATKEYVDDAATYTAGTGITISSNTVSLSTPVALANGGTGAATAGGARSNLGAAAAGANGDITSMTGLTGALGAPTKIDDSSGNEVLGFSSVASAVNEVTVQNAATGSAPQLQATGSDANINLGLVPKGTGSVTVGGPLSMGSNQINNVANPTAAQDAATKSYVDSAAAYTGGIGITVSTNTISLTTPVALANGGTSASTPLGARTTLGAAASGANADITSLSDLSGALQAPTQVNDVNGKEVFGFASVASAVNALQAKNAATGHAAELDAVGTDTDISINLVPKNGGVVQVSGNTVLTTVSVIDGGTY